MNVAVSVLFLRLNGFIHSDLYGYGLVFSYDWANRVWHTNTMVWTFLLAATALTVASIVPHYLHGREHSCFSKWTGFLVAGPRGCLSGFVVYFPRPDEQYRVE